MLPRIDEEITFRKLEILLAFMEAGNLARAAEQLGVSTVSVHRALHSLETGTRCSLFRLEGRNLQPTDAAHALADGIHYWRKSALTVDELLQEAVTPGGIAAASMAAMDKAGYRQAVQRGIRAGIKQARRKGASQKSHKTTPAST
jgi:pyrroline-5-carboxylate reductase